MAADGQRLLPPQRRRPEAGPLGVEAVDEVAVVDTHRAVALARLTDGRELVVPVVRDDGVWRRAIPGDGLSVTIFSAPSPFTVERHASVPDLDSSTERGLSADMSNELVVVDDLLAVKWQLLAEADHLAGPRLAAHLAAVGFVETPAAIATVTWDGRLIASVTQFLPDAVDGWEWMVSDLLAHVSSGATAPDWPSEVGQLVGRFHRACARSSEVINSPVETAPTLGVIVDHYRALLARVPHLDEEMRSALEPWTPRFADALVSVERAQDVVVLPVHGDLHAGQLLRWRDGIAIADFDGNPLLPPGHRGDPGPAAFDLACLLRSLDHVAHVVARRCREADDEPALNAALEWSTGARQTARDAYLSAGEATLIDDELLAAFESLSPLHEAVYAATFLPRWRYVPLGVLQRGW
ncbi:unannotated protein [freshwater metagenome]|uniref:Unannotated protein n=1 Tax=freshwater metagenome TaxID=449393 RepID=A0A6J7IY21_9ZZZZ